MKFVSILSTLFLTFAFALPAFSQVRLADAQVKSADAVEVLWSGEDEGAALSTTIDGRDYTCFDDGGAGDPALRPVTGCYCGDGIYLGVHCAGFPSAAVCCAVKCEELRNILDGQR